MSKNVIEWVRDEVKEFVNKQSVGELLSDTTEKYKNMEGDLIDSLLRAMSFMKESTIGEPLPLDDLFSVITDVMLIGDNPYESNDFIQSLMEKYELEVAKYKAANSNEVT